MSRSVSYLIAPIAAVFVFAGCSTPAASEEFDWNNFELSVAESCHLHLDNDSPNRLMTELESARRVGSYRKQDIKDKVDTALSSFYIDLRKYRYDCMSNHIEGYKYIVRCADTRNEHFWYVELYGEGFGLTPVLIPINQAACDIAPPAFSRTENGAQFGMMRSSDFNTIAGGF